MTGGGEVASLLFRVALTDSDTSRNVALTLLASKQSAEENKLFQLIYFHHLQELHL